MSNRTLFLAWQDNREVGEGRPWFPIGRLDVDMERPLYRFRYIRGAERAQRETGFPPMLEFPDLRENYQSKELFPIFTNRVIAPGRPDRMDYLNNLALPENADPVEILSVNGGQRITDAFEVFPKIVKRDDDTFRCRFFLHSLRYVNEEARRRIKNLETDEKLYVTLELTNPATGLALQFQTHDYYMIGWAPRYLVQDLAKTMVESPKDYSARVVKNNTLTLLSRQRVLIEFRGRYSDQLMSGDDFKPLID